MNGASPFFLAVLGNTTLIDANGIEHPIPSRKASEILAFLAMKPEREWSRDHLASHVWPDADLTESRNRLNVALHRFRQWSIDSGMHFPIEVSRSALKLSEDEVIVDVRRMQKLLVQAQRIKDDETRLSLLCNALKLARGTFLPGVDSPWVIFEREVIQREIHSALVEVASIVAIHGDPRGDVANVLKMSRTLPSANELSSRLSKISASDRSAAKRGKPTPRIECDQTVWNAAKDFCVEHNPNGAWSFGWTWDMDQPFSLFRCIGALVTPNGSLPRLRSTGWHELCAVANHSDHPFPFHEFVLLPGQLMLHPGPHGQRAVARWTCPRNAEYNVEFRGYAISPECTSDAWVVIDHEILCEGVVTPKSPPIHFAVSRKLSKGETVDVMVGAGDDGYNRDSTGIDLTLEMVG